MKKSIFLFSPFLTIIFFVCLPGCKSIDRSGATMEGESVDNKISIVVAKEFFRSANLGPSDVGDVYFTDKEGKSFFVSSINKTEAIEAKSKYMFYVQPVLIVNDDGLDHRSCRYQIFIITNNGIFKGGGGVMEVKSKKDVVISIEDLPSEKYVN